MPVGTTVPTVMKGVFWDHGTDQNSKLSDFVRSVTPSQKYVGTRYFVSVFHVHNILEDTGHSEHSLNSL